jgi:hypothetical protein
MQAHRLRTFPVLQPWPGEDPGEGLHPRQCFSLETGYWSFNARRSHLEDGAFIEMSE